MGMLCNLAYVVEGVAVPRVFVPSIAMDCATHCNTLHKVWLCGIRGLAFRVSRMRRGSRRTAMCTLAFHASGMGPGPGPVAGAL